MGLTLIVSERFDPHAELIETQLERRGQAYLRFHLEDFSQRSGEYRVEENGLETLEIRGHRIVIDDVDAVWYRRFARLECGAFVQGLWQRLSHVRWVSSPAAIRAASNKFEQRIRAKQCGFSVSDIGSAHGVSVRLIPQAYELRITVFGEQVFACRLLSPDRDDTRALNWEDPQSLPPHEATTIPDHLAESCTLLVRDYGLAYGAIDVVVTPEGEHVFLELNPNGQWAWIEERTGLPLGNALIDVLQRAS